MLEKGKLYRVTSYHKTDYVGRAVASDGYLWVCIDEEDDVDYLRNFKSVSTGETAAFYEDELEEADAGEG